MRTKGWRDSGSQIVHEIEGVNTQDTEDEGVREHRKKLERYNESRLDTEVGLRRAFLSILGNPTVNHVATMLEDINSIARDRLKAYDPTMQDEMGWRYVSVTAKIQIKCYKVEDDSISVDEGEVGEVWDTLHNWGQGRYLGNPKILSKAITYLSQFMAKYGVSPHGELVAANFELLSKACVNLKRLNESVSPRYAREQAGEFTYEDRDLLGKAKGDIHLFWQDEVKRGKVKLLNQQFWSREEASDFIVAMNEKGRNLTTVRPQTMTLYGTPNAEPAMFKEDTLRDNCLRDMESGLSAALHAQDERQLASDFEGLKRATIQYAKLFDGNAKYRQRYDTQTKTAKVSRVWKGVPAKLQ